MSLKDGVRAIEKHGILLVFPINNKKQPGSIWSSFFPRSEMRWEWDSGGDDRVSTLWHLREQLSRSNQVIYAKWYRGRATFFSRPIFAAALRVLNPSLPRSPVEGEYVLKRELSRESRHVYDTLQGDSPLSTKALRKLCELQGKANERVYNRAMKQLWDRLLVVGFGEVDDGAFPSLNIGATSALFEELWSEALELSVDEAWAFLREKLGEESPFWLQLQKQGRLQESASRS